MPATMNFYRSGRVIEVAGRGYAARSSTRTDQASAVTAELLERIRRPLAVEEKVRGQPPDIRRAARQSQSRPQLDELKARMKEIHAKLSAKARSQSLLLMRSNAGRRGPVTSTTDVWRSITSSPNERDEASRSGAATGYSPDHGPAASAPPPSIPSSKAAS